MVVGELGVGDGDVGCLASDVNQPVVNIFAGVHVAGQIAVVNLEKERRD